MYYLDRYMKKIILIMFLTICAVGFGFSQEPLDPVQPSYDEFEKKGSEAVLVFITIFVVVALVLMLRLFTEKMKTKDPQNPRDGEAPLPEKKEAENE
jgi:uncharacterized protein HemY